MRFEVSERVQTNADKEDILRGLEEQFKKVAQSVSRSGDTLNVKSVEASFGSVNRSDSATIDLREAEDGYLVVANVNYRPSVLFWIFVLIGLFTYIFWLIPIIFYLVQKKTVRSGIEEVFTRVKNEFMNASGKVRKKSKGPTDLDQLEKIGALKEKGLITEEEFQAKKKELLGL